MINIKIKFTAKSNVKKQKQNMLLCQIAPNQAPRAAEQQPDITTESSTLKAALINHLVVIY